MPETNSAQAEAILEDLRSFIETNSPVPTLDGETYMSTHVAFEGSSNQQSMILDWLVAHLGSSPEEALDLTSIGAGSGILDVPMLERLGGEKKINYLVIEPVPEQCVAFGERAAGVLDPENVTVDILESTLEDLETKRQFDHVLAIHSIYYFPVLRSALQKLVDLAKPGGEIVIAVAPFEQMNRLAQVFWQPQSDAQVWFEEDVQGALESMGITSVTRERIEGELPLEPGTPTADAIVNFLVQCPLESLPPKAHELVMAYLEEVGHRRDGRLAIPHPASILRFRTASRS